MSDQVEPIAMRLSSAARAVDLSERTLMRAIKSGDLVARRFGNEYRIEAAELRAWVKSWPADTRAS